MEASKGGTVLSDSDIREEVGGREEDVSLRMIIIKHVKMRLFPLVIIIKMRMGGQYEDVSLWDDHHHIVIL